MPEDFPSKRGAMAMLCGKFRRQQPSAAATKEDIKKEKTDKPNTATVSDFLRFTTRTDRICNVVGLLCACAAGVTQPLMTIVRIVSWPYL